MALRKLVSGGQTGVDRGALDAALAVDFPCGGWCPSGRMAEDGVIDARYPVVEMPSGGYRERTIQNVVDSDGTFVIYFDTFHGGTEETIIACIDRRKPYRLVDGNEIEATRAGELAAQFVVQHRVAVLNVAGPRASDARGGQRYAAEAIAILLERAPDWTVP